MQSSLRRSERIARVLSYLFLPPVLNITSFAFVIFSFESEIGSPWKIFLYTSIFTVILPILIFILFLRKGKIADPDARERTERHIPYIVFAVVITVGLLLIPWADHAPEIRTLFIIYLFNLIFLFLVNLFWKISAHTMGAGGFLGTALFVFGVWGFLALPVVIALAWARLELKCHTPAQIVAGALTGLANTLILFHYL